jgi:NAD-dependent dihydropyrimidine dehydrogenase PreA subunit
MSEQEIYEGLVNWLKQSWAGLPEADELLPLIKATYTPEEASLLTEMPYSGMNLEALAEMKQMDPAVLMERMDGMAQKGLVFRIVKGDTVRYSLNDAFFADYRSSFWGGATDERARAIAPLANQYYYHGFWDHMWKDTHTKGLRALPIEGTIEDTRGVQPYEEVVKVLDQHDYFSVSICPCRHRKKLDPDFEDSTYPMEVCLHFGGLGRYINENGMGREITRQEAGEILHKSAKAGLVHGVANWQQAPDTICNCDPNDCLFFEAFHKLKHARGMSYSNYRVRIDRDTCIGCGLCVKRCPMDALQVEDAPEAKDRITVVADDEKGEKRLKNKKGKVSTVDPDLCIGCGVCVIKCPSQSMALERKEVLEDPPRDVRDFAQRTRAEKLGAAKQEMEG